MMGALLGRRKYEEQAPSSFPKGYGARAHTVSHARRQGPTDPALPTLLPAAPGAPGGRPQDKVQIPPSDPVSADLPTRASWL